MDKFYEGLPGAANLQQSIILAQLQILRRLQATRAGSAGTLLSQSEAAPEIVVS